jgi:hypothetical protein
MKIEQRTYHREGYSVDEKNKSFESRKTFSKLMMKDLYIVSFISFLMQALSFYIFILTFYSLKAWYKETEMTIPFVQEICLVLYGAVYCLLHLGAEKALSYFKIFHQCSCHKKMNRERYLPQMWVFYVCHDCRKYISVYNNDN